MFRNTLITMATLMGMAAHADIKYLDVQPITSAKLSLRETWDQTKQFCYQATDGKSDKTCLPITAMSEIQLREGGKWKTDAQIQVFINALDPDLQKAALDFDRIYVRYLALNSNQDFVVHIFFVTKGSSDKSSQTVFEYGSVVGNKATASSMSFSNGLEYVGALILAIASDPNAQKDQKDLNAINALVVKSYSPLLKIGENVVSTYLNQLSDSPAKLP